jgi:cytochrome c oxidase assembly protein subunit 11
MPSSRRNLSLALSLAAFAVGMVLLAYASVPLYRVFCRATGFGGVAARETVKRHKPTDRAMVVRFDANVNPGLPWSFRPAQTDVMVRVGEEKHIDYIARNDSNHTTKGTATFNVTPTEAGPYFSKIQCFCFTEQELKPGEEKRLGVTFFIDPSINDDRTDDEIRTITLSYTFFPVQKE